MRRLLELLVVMCAAMLCSAAAVAQQNVDLIVSGGIVVTMDAGRAIYQVGSVAVRGLDRCCRAAGRGGGEVQSPAED